MMAGRSDDMEWDYRGLFFRMWATYMSQDDGCPNKDWASKTCSVVDGQCKACWKLFINHELGGE
jgi:hypothetical protein